MPRYMLADRADDHSGEATVTPRPDHEQRCISASVQQALGGGADREAEGDVALELGWPTVCRRCEQLSSLHIERLPHLWGARVINQQGNGVDEVQSAATSAGFGERPVDGPVTVWRAVDADNHRTRWGVRVLRKTLGRSRRRRSLRWGHGMSSDDTGRRR